MGKNLRIVYMGTPDFAVYPLRLLIENGYNVVAVVTMPDKSSGRGLKVNQSAVKKYAVEHNLPILQPEKLKDDVFVDDLRSFNADLGIVVAFRMLPQVVWDMPRLGTFNLHASLLPDYRGAAPINWAVINGDTKSGVTTFMLDKQIDTGKIIAQKECDILEDETAGTLHDKLMVMGGELVLESVDSIALGTAQFTPQEYNDFMRPAPKLFKEDYKINWEWEVDWIYNFIRGLSPYPAAWSDFGKKYGDNFSMKVYRSSKIYQQHSLECGTVVTDGKKVVKIACKGGFISLEDVQSAGKKRMDIESFLRGNKL